MTLSTHKQNSTPDDPFRLDPILDPISLKPSGTAQDCLVPRRSGKPTNPHGLGQRIM